MATPYRRSDRANYPKLVHSRRAARILLRQRTPKGPHVFEEIVTDLGYPTFVVTVGTGEEVAGCAPLLTLQSARELAPGHEA